MHLTRRPHARHDHRGVTRWIASRGTHSLDSSEEPGEGPCARNSNRSVLILREDDLFPRLDSEFRWNANGGTAAVAEGASRYGHRQAHDHVVYTSKYIPANNEPVTA